MKRFLKISAKTLGWLLIIAVAFVFVIALLIQLPFAKNILRERVLSAVNQSLLGTVELERIEGNLFTHIRLRDITVKNERGDLIARIPQADANYNLLGAIRGQLTVSNVEIDRPLAFIHVYQDGSFNFETIAKPSPDPDSPPGTFEVFLDKIKLNDGLILYADESQNTPEHPLDPQRSQALAELLTAFNDQPAINGDRQKFTDRVHNIISPEQSPTQTPPTALPIMASAQNIQLDASFALRSQQMITFDIKNFQTDANLDTLPTILPIRSQNIAGFYEPAAADVQLEHFNLGHNTALHELHLKATLNTKTDTFGNRFTTTPNQLVANLTSLQIGQELAKILIPDHPLKTDININLQAAGNLEDLSFLTDIYPFPPKTSLKTTQTASQSPETSTLAIRIKTAFQTTKSPLPPTNSTLANSSTSIL